MTEKRKKHTGCHVRLPVHDKSTNTMGATAVEAEGLGTVCRHVRRKVTAVHRTFGRDQQE